MLINGDMSIHLPNFNRWVKQRGLMDTKDLSWGVVEQRNSALFIAEPNRQRYSSMDFLTMGKLDGF